MPLPKGEKKLLWGALLAFGVEAAVMTADICARSLQPVAFVLPITAQSLHTNELSDGRVLVSVSPTETAYQLRMEIPRYITLNALTITPLFDQTLVRHLGAPVAM